MVPGNVQGARGLPSFSLDTRPIVVALVVLSLVKTRGWGWGGGSLGRIPLCEEVWMIPGTTNIFNYLQSNTTPLDTNSVVIEEGPVRAIKTLADIFLF